MTDPNALAMPPKIEFSQMLGFAQTMYKLMMEGRSKEVLDTIDTNLKHWKEGFKLSKELDNRFRFCALNGSVQYPHYH